MEAALFTCGEISAAWNSTEHRPARTFGLRRRRSTAGSAEAFAPSSERRRAVKTSCA
jgi:hypothetical protein